MFGRPVLSHPEQVREGAVTVLSAVEGEQRRPQPGEGGAGAARLIARDDLVARLDRAVAGKVTTISASAGSGKTSLLRAWAGRPGLAHRVAFVPVRRDEQDAPAFWLALLNAVRQAPGAVSDTEAPAAAPDFDIRTLVRCQKCACSVWPAVCWIGKVPPSSAYAVSSDRQAA
jgi:hypothetical protein